MQENLTAVHSRVKNLSEPTEHSPCILAMLFLKMVLSVHPQCLQICVCVLVRVSHMNAQFQSTDHAKDLKPCCSPDVCIMES